MHRTPNHPNQSTIQSKNTSIKIEDNINEHIGNIRRPPLFCAAYCRRPSAGSGRGSRAGGRGRVRSGAATWAPPSGCVELRPPRDAADRHRAATVATITAPAPPLDLVEGAEGEVVAASDPARPPGPLGASLRPRGAEATARRHRPPPRCRRCHHHCRCPSAASGRGSRGGGRSRAPTPTRRRPAPVARQGERPGRAVPPHRPAAPARSW